MLQNNNEKVEQIFKWHKIKAEIQVSEYSVYFNEIKNKIKNIL